MTILISGSKVVTFLSEVLIERRKVVNYKNYEQFKVIVDFEMQKVFPREVKIQRVTVVQNENFV